MFVVKLVEFRRKNYYSSDIKALGPLEGKLELLNGEGTSLNMNLTKEQTQRIMEVVAEALVDTAKEAGTLLKGQIVAQVGGVELLGSDK